MSFQAKGKKINLEEIKNIGKLNTKQKEMKSSRDKELAEIIQGIDQRFLLIMGPCSADNPSAVLEYAHRLSKLQQELVDDIFIIMRVYTAKPRTNGEGYKGLIHQGNSSGNQDLLAGLQVTRRLHSQIITETGLTTADEMLYCENLPLLDDLVSYIAVGARSVENQVYRFVSSGIDGPVGMKNPTSGNLNVLFNGIYAAQKSQRFPYNQQEVVTTGNPLAHGILRGFIDESGQSLGNFSKESLLSAINHYEKRQLENPFLVIDCNHDNSGKNEKKQIEIVRESLLNRQKNKKIKAYVRSFMIESYLEGGRQESAEIFGKSITDPCLGWEESQSLAREIRDLLKKEKTNF